MGLDTYAVLPSHNPEEELRVAPAELFRDVEGLCGGVFSGNGDGSFRGKVYNDFVESVTGQSLYQRYIPPEVVSEMADALAAYAEDRLPPDVPGSAALDGYEYSPTAGEVRALVHFFRICKEHGLALHGWW